MLFALPFCRFNAEAWTGATRFACALTCRALLAFGDASQGRPLRAEGLVRAGSCSGFAPFATVFVRVYWPLDFVLVSFFGVTTPSAVSLLVAGWVSEIPLGAPCRNSTVALSPMSMVRLARDSLLAKCV